MLERVNTPPPKEVSERYNLGIIVDLEQRIESLVKYMGIIENNRELMETVPYIEGQIQELYKLLELAQTNQLTKERSRLKRELLPLSLLESTFKEQQALWGLVKCLLQKTASLDERLKSLEPPVEESGFDYEDEE